MLCHAALCCAVLCWVQYKFIVDGDWKHDPNQRAMRDENGNVNNVIEVQEYVPENLENISGFDPPPSPSARCAPISNTSPVHAAAARLRKGSAYCWAAGMA